MIELAWAQTGEGPPAQPSFLIQLFPFLIIFAIFYFLVIRPQVKRQRAHQELVRGLSKGDRVVTQGGLFGVVVGSKDDVVVLKIADNTKVEVLKNSIQSVRGKASDG